MATRRGRLAGQGGHLSAFISLDNGAAWNTLFTDETNGSSARVAWLAVDFDVRLHRSGPLDGHGLEDPDANDLNSSILPAAFSRLSPRARKLGGGDRTEARPFTGVCLDKGISACRASRAKVALIR